MTKKIVDRRTVESLLALAAMGKVRIVKEYENHEPVLVAVSASGRSLGIIGEKYKYRFNKFLLEHSANDGLFEGFPQTTKDEMN